MAQRQRNWEALPLLDDEGYYVKKVPHDIESKERDPEKEKDFPSGYVKPHWTKGLTPWQRLYSHHTLTSIRQTKLLHRPHLQNDDLDFVLSSTYQQNIEIFADKVDTLLQPETRGMDTWRLLRNQRVIPPPAIIPRGHPCVFGGLHDKKSIHHVKLGIGSFHSTQTNSGYSRKDDGTFYTV